jgi:hypothetical protein
MAKNDEISLRIGKSATGTGLFLKCDRPGLDMPELAETRTRAFYLFNEFEAANTSVWLKTCLLSEFVAQFTLDFAVLRQNPSRRDTPELNKIIRTESHLHS